MEFIILIILLVPIFNLYGRVNKLENDLKDKVKDKVTNVFMQSAVVNQPTVSQPIRVIEERIETITEETDEPNVFLDWLKEDWMLKLGGLLLIIGFGWFLSVTYVLIGPGGRVALGIIAGTLFILLGYWRIRNYINQGGIFLVLGSTVILLTVFASRVAGPDYDFFTPLSALVVMFLSVAFVAIASVKYNSRALSLLSLILAGIVPLLTNAPASDHVGLFAYLFIVVLGAIWIVALNGQRELNTAALIMIAMYSAPHILTPSMFPLVNMNTLLLFAYAFSAVFFLTNTAGLLKLKDKEIVPDLLTAAGNGVFLLVWIMNVAPKEWQSLIISAWMLIFIVGAFLIFKITQKSEPFYVYAGIGAMMLAAATAVELSGAALTIAYIIEITLGSLISYIILNDRKVSERVSLLLAVPMFFSVENMISHNWNNSVLHKDFFVLLLLSLTLLGLGLFFSNLAKEARDKDDNQLSMIWLVFGSAYAYILLWLSLHAGLEAKNTATIISLIIYTVIGIIFYFKGLSEENENFRIYGSILVGLVIARLLLVDVWSMEKTSRIVMFFILGALLVATAFLGKSNKLKL